MKKQQHKGFFSITNQLRYGLVLIVVIPLFFVSGILTYFSFQTHIQQLEILQHEHSELVATKINSYLDDLQRKLSYLARLQGLTNLSSENQQKFLTALTRYHSAYETVAILNNSGQVIAAVSPYEKVNIDNILKQPGILNPLKYQEDFVSFVEIDPIIKEPIVTLSVPIRNQKDVVDGVLIARINLKFLRYFINQTQVGNTGYAYIIDNRNFLIVSKDKLLKYSEFQDLSNQPLIKEIQKLKNDKSLLVYRGLKGVEVIGNIAPITSLRWQVVVELPITEVYAPLRQMLLFMGVSITITIIIAVISGIWFQRQIVLPLQRLTTAAEQISTGNLDTDIKVKQNNEMGVLAATFNQMTLQLRELIIDLKHNEERFRIMVEGSEQVFFYIHDNDHVFQYFSPSVQIVLGYEPEELIGQTCEFILVDDAEKAAIFELVDNVLLTGEGAAPFTVLSRHKNGQILFTEIVETPMIVNGKVVGMQGFARDITKRRMAEIELNAALKRDRLIAEIALKIRKSLNLQEILNTTVAEVRQFLQADRVYISNFNPNWHGKIFAESTSTDWELDYDIFLQDNNFLVEITNLFSEITLFQVDDISQVKLSPINAYYAEKFQMKSCLAVQIMVDNNFFVSLVVHQCSGVRYWQETEVELLQQLATQLAIAIQQSQLFEEIQTLNVNLEHKVQERTAQLQDKMMELEDLYKRQDEFLHAVSHDLRTPIMGTMMLLKHWQQSSLETIPLPRNILERMVESGEHQLNLINSLLETHATENRGIKLNCKSLDMKNLISSIITDLEPLLTKNQAKIHNSITSELPIINGDALQLRRVFENLITNALNHNSPGLEITIKANLQNTNIQFFIEDNGLGMSPEQCVNIFERYARGNHSRSTGIGLGLYLCRQIINAHGGEIGVISSLGAGASFWFTLPENKFS